MSRKRNIAIAACAICFGLAAVAEADRTAPAEKLDLELVAAAGEKFDRSLEVGALTVRYESLLERARRLGVERPTRTLQDPVATPADLREEIHTLGAKVERAREAAREESAYAASGGTVEGVSLATLNAIAACESGGDPAAVNPAGYYGKYQFDMGTWASVGGSGNPAEASEAEQDYRAALLYSRAGASPWPVCGA